MNKFAGLQPSGVREREQKYQDDRDELLGRKSYRVTSQTNGRNDVEAVRDAIGQHAHEVRERYRDGGDGACLDDKEQRPAKEKTCRGTIGFAEEHVLAAGTGHHRG